MRDPGAFVPPMLGVTADRAVDRPGWRLELKWDGWRAMVSFEGSLKVWSRRGHSLLGRYPVLEELTESLRAPAVVDGELVGWADGRPSFEALAHPGADVVLVAFDCLYDGAGWHLHKPLSERLQRLADVVRPHRRVVLARPLDGDAATLLANCRELNLEGLMAKSLDGRYHPGRRSDVWQKFLARRREWFWGVGLNWDGHQAWITLAEEHQGRRRVVGRVAAPVPDDLMRRDGTAASWAAVPRRVRVEFRARTADGHLRHPVFRGFQDGDDAP